LWGRRDENKRKLVVSFTPAATADPTGTPRSRLGAFGHPAFAVIWTASTFALGGIAMSDTASAWLMTNLNAEPRAVSLVQVASSLPMFLFTLPAGALADIVEARRYLIALETLITAVIAVFATMIFFHWQTPEYLLATIVERGLVLGGSGLARDHAAPRAPRRPR
jgi:MFS family permease